MHPLPRPARPLPLALACLALGLLSACVRPAEQTAPENNPTPKADSGTQAFAAAPEAPKQPTSVAGIPAAAIGAAERAKAKVEIASTATAESGEIYRKAQALFAEKKYAEALATLNALQPELLTPAQEKAVAELRAKIQAAM